ncbi:MAG: Mov34/MPN/PAD-1 family protein [Acidobacteriota bacterium]|nr:Mov34/MPN/PAD-1 family protein [Acidobacteriota bacterium]
MTMSDARISMFAAPMSELVAKFTRTPPRSGVLMVGRVGDDEVSLTWERTEVEPVAVIRLDATTSVARVAAHVAEAIEAEVARWPKVETGGVLMGRYSEVADVFYVTDVLDAPPDSTRSASEFILGTEGLRARIDQYISRHNGALYCLGTWHSHLKAEGASGTDRNTATILAHARISPSLMVIHTPAGYRGLVAADV